ncbi:MAG TPA: SH3 domain-containing protein, partial [Clostridiales bacterium]|nr:SH3 domain-containing protein [Clostridiales bacterium]
MKKATKLAIGISAISLLVLTSPIDVRAAVQFPEEGIEGIALSLDNCRDSSEDIDKVLTEILNTKIISPYANLGVSTATSYVNIRESANTDSEIVGKLYRGCAADILDREDGWVKIKSGDVEGYINTDYLAIGKEAEEMIEEFATKYAIIQTETLRVREEQNAESKILTLVPKGEEYIIVKEHKGWVEILLGVDEDNNGNDFTGFLSKDYIDIRVDFEYAISIEEENRRIAAEEAAIKAEQERMQKLAEEKAKKAEDKRRADAAAKKAAEDAKKNNSNSNNSNSNN